MLVGGLKGASDDWLIDRSLIDTGGGIIPPQDGMGRPHMAFACSHEALLEWEDRLTAPGVTIEGRTGWKRAGKSVYFRDPKETCWNWPPRPDCGPAIDPLIRGAQPAT